MTDMLVIGKTQENSQALNTRIDETVQMSTYQIKTQLKQKREELVVEYKEIQQAQDDAQAAVRQIKTRLSAKMRTFLEEKALDLLIALDPFIDVGMDSTYFASNSNKAIEMSEMAKALVVLPSNHLQICSSGLEIEKAITQKKVPVSGYICIHGYCEENYANVEESECVFGAKAITQTFALTKDEIMFLKTSKMIGKSRDRCNKEINDVDLKLKNVEGLTEDIRYALLTKKAESEGDTATLDLATNIANVYINGNGSGLPKIGN